MRIKETSIFAFIIARIVRSLNIWMQLFNRPRDYTRSPCVRLKVVVREKKSMRRYIYDKLPVLLSAYDKYKKKKLKSMNIAQSPRRFASGACKSLLCPTKTYAAALMPYNMYIASVN